MICDLCGKDKPLTYHSFVLPLRSVCGQCIREKLPFTLGNKDETLRDAVVDVLSWMMTHPHRDYLDAAFAVVAAPPPHRSQAASCFSTNRWPELIVAVKEATQNWANLQ
jgi:hypothetical protein